MPSPKREQIAPGCAFRDQKSHRKSHRMLHLRSPRVGSGVTLQSQGGGALRLTRGHSLWGQKSTSANVRSARQQRTSTTAPLFGSFDPRRSPLHREIGCFDWNMELGSENSADHTVVKPVLSIVYRAMANVTSARRVRQTRLIWSQLALDLLRCRRDALFSPAINKLKKASGQLRLPRS